MPLSENDTIARMLFTHQPVLMPTVESDIYRLGGKLLASDATLLILSNTVDNIAKQQEIFNRMLPRVPETDAQIVYTSQTSISPTQLKMLSKAKHILLCGVELNGMNVEQNQNFTLGNKKVLVTSSIENIDSDPQLKKTMWLEWMKQFNA